MELFENYSEVKFMEGNLGGCHYCTTKYEVLFNLNDILEILDIKSKQQRINWKNKLGDHNIINGVKFKRIGVPSSESFITTNVVMLLFSIYGEELIDKLERKRSAEFLVADILDEVEKDDKMKENIGTLSSQFAIESLKLDNRIAKCSNDALISILEMNHKVSHHIPFFDVDNEYPFIDNLRDYDNTLNKIYEVLNNYEFEYPEYNKEYDSDNSLLWNDYEDLLEDDENL